MKNPPPRSLDDTCAESRIRSLLSTGASLDITYFWHEVESGVFPLITKSSSNAENREVTFLWRSEEPLQSVYVRLNRVTDKKDVKKGFMTRIPSTDIWILTLELPSSYRGSYSFIEIPSGMPSEEISQLGGRFSLLPGMPDPFNKASEINIRGFGESVLSLDLAPAQTEWDDTSRMSSGVLSTSYSFIAGHRRRVRFHLPEVPISDPLGLLVLPDAETWFDRIGITRAIDIAITNGRIKPMAILGIDNVNESDRVQILGGNKELILDIVEKLIPRLYKDYPNIVWAGRSNTILAGQSLGGVTALMAALYASEIFGRVISHSPSMWWDPNRNTPVMFNENDSSWVSKQVLSKPPKDVHIRLGVGSLEGATVPHLHQLHQSLLATGVKSELSIYTGGHDYAWWRGAIIDGLTDM
ncbi:alpha/beta hydrolase-fold protein [Enterobacteriaceae bacterium H18W14]|uniref:alpha/beta hydrolase-fold protein n=1 Tax=Dryocola boscaweniae TaxID=2925397 RepID=UPI0022F04806|nr:alpha/beta hydrolase-fold protein [Dryocola boscaweniae]MCT4717364.1 alpha/beta hydrolase-fold protein [Dryocola boscaweniae]